MHEGTGRSAYYQVPGNIRLAGKTGTTNGSRDSWFAGFSQDMLAVVWMGDDDNKPTALTGASGALQVGARFMRKSAPASFEPSLPDSVVWGWVDAASGSSAGANCPGAIRIPYIQGSQPASIRPCTDSSGSSNTVDWVDGWLE